MATNPPAPPSRRRKRPTLACEPCRRKKIRCDRNIPCEHCTRSKSDLCTYLYQDEPPENEKHIINTPVIPQQTSPSEPARPPSATQPPSSTASLFHFPSAVAGLSQENLLRKDRNSSSNSATSRLADRDVVQKVKEAETVSTSPSQAEGDHPIVRGIFSKTRFFGQSHWMNSVVHFREVYQVMQKCESDGGTQTRILYYRCKTLAKAIKAHEAARSSGVQTGFADYVPSRRTTDKLVQAYLRTFESVYRILHVPSWMQEYEEYWNNPRAANEEFIIKLLLVIAIGMAFSPGCEEVPSTMHARWIHEAQAWLSTPDEKGRINISGVQIYCLLLLARKTNAVGGDTVWISAGSLLRIAMHLGLHIDPSRSLSISFFDQEIRRRLWATVLEISLQASMDAGGLPLISLQDIDTEPPLNINDDQIDKDTDLPPVPQSMGTFTSTSIQIALMLSFPVRLEIARFINDFRSESSYEKTLQLASRLSSCCKANFTFLRSVPSSSERHPSAFQLRILTLLTYRFFLALHHPFALKAASDPTLYFSRKVALEVSLSILGPPGSPDAQHSDDYSRLQVVGTGIFRAVPVQAASIICDEIIKQCEEEACSFIPASGSFYRESLRGMIKDYVNLLSARIKFGETNVRGHLLFSALLAQIDALRVGRPVEAAIMDALATSLETCFSLLKRRADECEVNGQWEMAALEIEQLPDTFTGEAPQDWLFADYNLSMIHFDDWAPSGFLSNPFNGTDMCVCK